MQRFRRLALALSTLLLALAACDEETIAPAAVTLRSDSVRVVVDLSPFQMSIFDAEGTLVLATEPGSDGAYGAPGATFDEFVELPQVLPGWDGYEPHEGPWQRAVDARVRDQTETSAVFDLVSGEVVVSLQIAVEKERVRVGLTTRDGIGRATPPNKSSIAFKLPENEHFFGLGERYATLDHRGRSLYSWAEEGGLGQGEDAPAGPENPSPNGLSMTYFPVPFFLSNQGYGLSLDTTYRSELHFGSEKPESWRAAVSSPAWNATIYVSHDPLHVLDLYTEDKGRPMDPAPWIFGPRRRVGSGSMVEGVPEIQAMRNAKIPVTAVDDAVHFLPALSQIGREAELMTWTTNAHALGYKALAYNNPYVATTHENAKADYEYGRANGYFVKGPDGEPAKTFFISGAPLEIAAIDLTNPDAVAWFQGLLKRTLDFGYDGWMHDFGEYTRRDAVFFDGRRGDEVHNEFPVLSAKAAHDLMEREKPGDYLFFVRSGYAGSQQYVPTVWGGDAEATFDETQGLPSSVRGGLNLSMVGVPYWGSDMTGFKCLTDAPNDKEVFLRWVEFGAVSPVMMEQNACTNPAGEKKTKWNLWNDQETIDHYKKYAGLHTRLLPYFLVLKREAVRTGRPMTMHPFLLFPKEPWVYEVEDAFYLGPALYVSPVVRRGVTVKTTFLPPGARYVNLEDYRLYDGGAAADIPAPLGKMPLFLVEGQILPMLDPSIDTLAPATDPTVVDPSDVADRLDVMVALGIEGSATLTLDDGTVLTARRVAQPAPFDGLSEVTEADIATCASCFVVSTAGDLARLRANSAAVPSSELALGDLRLTASGASARRIRWDVLRLP